ncbi:MEIKN protein, partial [Xiphorhynchus elegans]|nr:MEIKN protein [Xiphorhynchus elegans]
MTLPTGVSTFLIDCLDVDSTADFNNTSDSLKSYSSPEIFRDDNSERSNFYSVDLGKYKNSTLLDSSKAVTIDKIPQMSNLSAILGNSLLQYFTNNCSLFFPSPRKSQSNFTYSSSALNISTTLAGKKLCKITAARERTPALKSDMRCPAPLGPESKPANQTAKPKRLKRKIKETSCDLLEGSSSSFRQLDAPGNTSAQSEGLTGVVPIKAADAVVCLCHRKEICSIVRLSPKQEPSRLQRVPVNRKEFHFPKGVPEGKRINTWLIVHMA